MLGVELRQWGCEVRRTRSQYWKWELEEIEAPETRTCPSFGDSNNYLFCQAGVQLHTWCSTDEFILDDPDLLRNVRLR